MLSKRRPIFNMITRLENVPKEWLNHVEPKIMRGPFLPCWVWTGALDRNGYPVMQFEGQTIMMHRFVAKIFYNFPDSWYVTRSCNVQNCLNPAHIVVKPTRTKRNA